MTSATKSIRTCVRHALGSRRVTGGALLAISGGRDSVVLLDAAVAVARGAVRGVATFDHGTGPHATAAAALVRDQAAALGVPVVSGTADDSATAATEAAWRDARWRFLRAAAAELGAAAVATAHTADDQLETVAMRALRGAGARGLAALTARAPDVVRPLLPVTRAAVAAYAAEHGLRWVDDPSNADRRYLRARVRADLLPAIGRVRPDAALRLGAVAAQAAAWRADAERWVELVAAERAPVARLARLAGLGPEALAVFWPAFAARAGVRLDRRAIARLVAFTRHAARRVADGTVQPARVPVAGVRRAGGPHAAVELVYAPHPAAGAARVWQFVVRAGPHPTPPERGPWRGGPAVA